MFLNIGQKTVLMQVAPLQGTLTLREAQGDKDYVGKEKGIKRVKKKEDWRT